MFVCVIRIYVILLNLKGFDFQSTIFNHTPIFHCHYHTSVVEKRAFYRRIGSVREANGRIYFLRRPLRSAALSQESQRLVWEYSGDVETIDRFHFGGWDSYKYLNYKMEAGAEAKAVEAA